jgi:hypothetical protein
MKIRVQGYIREDGSNPYKIRFDGLAPQAAAKVATAALFRTQDVFQTRRRKQGVTSGNPLSQSQREFPSRKFVSTSLQTAASSPLYSILAL